MTSVPVPAAMPSVEEMLAAYNAVWQHATGIDAHNAPIVRHEAMSAVLDLFAPILAEKEREIEGVKADLAKLMDPELKHLRIEDGSIDVALTGPIVQHMGLVISEHFRASGAESYIEMCYHAKTEPFETFVWTIQKRVGKNSPHELRAKAEARALAVEAALAGERERCAKIAESFVEAALKCDRCGDTRTTYVPGGCTGERVYRESDEFKTSVVLNGAYEANRYFEKHLCNPREMDSAETIAAIAAAIRAQGE